MTDLQHTHSSHTIKMKSCTRISNYGLIVRLVDDVDVAVDCSVVISICNGLFLDCRLKTFRGHGHMHRMEMIYSFDLQLSAERLVPTCPYFKI
jgi:hypothetical protein